MKELGERIKKRRLELDMTQAELASRLGYSHKSTIGKIENGVNDITQSKIVDFAHALNTTVAYLMGWDEPTLDDEFLALLSQMTDDQKRLYLSIGRAMLGKDSQHIDSV